MDSKIQEGLPEIQTELNSKAKHIIRKYGRIINFIIQNDRAFLENDQGKQIFEIFGQTSIPNGHQTKSIGRLHIRL